MARFDRVMEHLTPPAAVLGWCEPEEQFVERLSQFGHYLDNTAAGTNLSFHTGVPPVDPPPFRQPTEPRIDKPERKVYLSFVSNEGDTTPSLVHLFYRGWLSPGRGNVPLNWAINPDLIRRFPAVVEYLFDTRTAYDHFVCAPCGAGYSVPRSMAHLDAFIRHTAECLESIELREMELWYPSVGALKRYAELLPGINGMVVAPHPAQPSGDLFSVGDRKVPVELVEVEGKDRAYIRFVGNGLVHETGSKAILKTLRDFLSEPQKKFVEEKEKKKTSPFGKFVGDGSS